MKIVNLYAENLKRLSAVEITPDGNLVQITGKNGQGKTSVLDAIWWALEGAKGIQAAPIRKGEEKALIRVDLGDMVATRRFNLQENGSYTTSITVESGEGAKYSSPQKLLDKLLGDLTFDPLGFTRLKSRDQVMALRSLVPGFDFDASEANAKAAFDERTEVNRRVKSAAATVEQLAQGLPDEIPEKVSVSDLMEQWNEAATSNNILEAREAKREGYRNERQAVSDQMDQLAQKLSEMDTEIASWDDLPDPVDADAIKARMEGLEQSNRIAEQAAQRDAAAKKMAEDKARAEELTSIISYEKDEAAKAVASAELPGDGMTIEDGEVYLAGVPFGQASDAQQLQASIGVAMALNPKLKVIRVRDGSLLDDDAMKVLADMADANDYQIWIERVDSSGTVGFVLEDGHIKGQTIEPKAKAEAAPKAKAVKPEGLKAQEEAKAEMMRQRAKEEAEKPKPETKDPQEDWVKPPSGTVGNSFFD